jgi:hypothetical protein
MCRARFLSSVENLAPVSGGTSGAQPGCRRHRGVVDGCKSESNDAVRAGARCCYVRNVRNVLLGGSRGVLSNVVAVV